MKVYFDNSHEPDQSLPELKFRELILTIADNPVNTEALLYFCSLLQDPQNVSLVRVMEKYFLLQSEVGRFCQTDFKEFIRIQKRFSKAIRHYPWQMVKGKTAESFNTSAF